MKYLVIWGTGYDEQRIPDTRKDADMYASGVSIVPGDTKVIDPTGFGWWGFFVSSYQ